METSMVALTDPADELARACDRIIHHTPSKSGEGTVADAIGVDPWSKEFFQAVFCLIEQADRIKNLLTGPRFNDTFRARAYTHLDGIKHAFSPHVLRTQWDQHNSTRWHLSQHVSSVAMLSPTVATIESYPHLSDEELESLLADVDQLIGWLSEHQLEQNDFLRAALLEGLQTYRFRLAHVGWLGWNYSAEALRSTIGAYLAVERGQTSAQNAPITEALLIKAGDLFGRIWNFTGVAHDALDRAGTAVKLYGAIAMAREGGSVIAAITHQIAS